MNNVSSYSSKPVWTYGSYTLEKANSVLQSFSGEDSDATMQGDATNDLMVSAEQRPKGNYQPAYVEDADDILESLFGNTVQPSAQTATPDDSEKINNKVINKVIKKFKKAVVKEEFIKKEVMDSPLF